MLVKPVTPRGRILDIYNPKHTCTHVTHLYTCDMAPPSFWCGSDAPEHLSGETLDPLQKTLVFPSTAGTGVERG